MAEDDFSLLGGAAGAPEIQPLTNVDDLLKWRFAAEECRFCAAVQPLVPRRDGGLDVDRPRLLACHDMRGGYLEDRLLQGGGDATAYIFRHWHCIDAFVYFSHKLVTIPPPGWTNAAHLHGVPVLGTLITEWEEGAAACAALLASDATAERAAHQLASLAEHLGFDGWIINIENDLPRELVPRLLLFVRALTDAVHAAVPHGKVLWYDALTIEGRLEWQNALTPLNQPFFDACDGIWINYTWMESTPKDTATVAEQQQRKFDVYMGIDSFGRGTFGGGGMKCNIAIEASLNAGLSVALFACGWPYEMTDILEGARNLSSKIRDTDEYGDDERKKEKKGNEGGIVSWQERDDEFWRLIRKAWGLRRVTVHTLPFFTDFSIGIGQDIACSGCSLHSGPWYNLSLQSPQPDLSLRGPCPAGFAAGVTTAVSFSGGASLHISGPVCSPMCLRLFRTAACVPRTGLRARFTVAVGGGVGLRLCLRLRKKERKNHGKEVEEEAMIELGSTAVDIKTRDSSKTLPYFPNATFKPASRITEEPFSAGLLPLSCVSGGSSPGGAPQKWTTLDFALQPGDLPKWATATKGDGAMLTSIEVVAAPKVPGATCQCSAFIGGVAVWAGQLPLPQCTAVKGLQMENIIVEKISLDLKNDLPNDKDLPLSSQQLTLTATLAWVPPPGINICYIWMRAGTVGVGTATNTQEREEESFVYKTGQKVNWSAPQWVGVACCAAYKVHGLALPEGAVGVKLIVATSAAGAMQPLREAATVTLKLRPGPEEAS